MPRRSRNNRTKTEKAEKTVDTAFSVPYHFRHRLSKPSRTKNWLKELLDTLPPWCDPKLLFSEEARNAFNLQADYDRKTRLLAESRQLLSDCLKELLTLEK